jgi:hypothetical protein
MRQPTVGCVSDVLVLVRGQRSRLVQHGLAHADLPDVVHPPADLDLLDRVGAQANGARDRDGSCSRGSEWPWV